MQSKVIHFFFDRLIQDIPTHHITVLEKTGELNKITLSDDSTVINLRVYPTNSASRNVMLLFEGKEHVCVNEPEC